MLDEHLKELADQMLNGKSENLIQYLEYVAKFHNYSFGNIMLALSQKNNITRLAGFKQWKKLGRNVKKGEHGALLSLEGSLFSVPCVPLKEVRDPTGAGDSFAGGMMGYLMSKTALTAQTYREALVYGTVMASFAVEDFSVGRLKTLNMDDIEERAELLKDMIRLIPRNINS